jgi:hypothetical protein
VLFSRFPVVAVTPPAPVSRWILAAAGVVEGLRPKTILDLRVELSFSIAG